MNKLLSSFLVIAAMSVPAFCSAQAYPAKSVRLIIPFAPGGANDILGRLIGAKLSESMKQQFIIDNRAGAGGTIGADLAAKSPPDGYTLVIGHIGTLAVNPTLYKKLTYDPLKDFQAISLFAKVASVMVIHPSLPVKSVKDLVALAIRQPGALVYGSGGNGGAGHLATEYFKLMAKVDMGHIPYKGTGPALVDLLAGQTQLVFAGVPGAVAHIKTGRLRALGVSTSNRLPTLPDVPTVGETLPGYEATQWYGVLAPTGTPAAIVSRLNREIGDSLKDPKVQERLVSGGSEPFASTPEEFSAYIKSEIDHWAPIIKAAGIRVD